MGADGGSIPRREELVKLKQKDEKPDQSEIDRIKWSLCSISKEILQSPIVTCRLGYLYNKETIIKHLIDKNIPASFNHIGSLKDVFPVTLKMNPVYGTKGKDEVIERDESLFICPITGDEAAKNHKFIMIRSCGCAMSERAFRECHSDTCLVCSKPFSPEDVIKLNPDDEERATIKQTLKKPRKEKKRKEEKSDGGDAKKKKKKSKSTEEVSEVKNGKEEKL